MPRLACLALATLSALPLVACTDEAPGEPIVDTGAYHTFAQTGFAMPASQADAVRLGFDLDDDGRAENQIGALIAALAGFGLDLTGASADAFTSGQVVALHRVRADALTDDASVSWQLLAGAPTAAPPRFDGTDAFTVMADAGTLYGAITGGQLTAGDANLTLRVPFFPGQHPLPLPLDQARVRIDLRDGACTGSIGGVLSVADRDATVLPVLAAQVVAHMAAHPDHAFTATARDVFDRDEDGTVTVDEVATLTRGLVRADLSADAASGEAPTDGISVAVGVRCVPARF